MPHSESQQFDQSTDPLHSEALSASEALFLLSICRDEDDAAALRADLKRSPLEKYKMQRCVHLDDAFHLLQVCNFDLAFVRLDDFQDRQAAVDMIRQADKELSIVALLSGRLLAENGFRMPNGVDTHCRLEDLSPSLASYLVTSVLEQKRERAARLRLAQELNYALEMGELGSWSLDLETGLVNLNEKAAEHLALTAPKNCRSLDALLASAQADEQDRVRRLVGLAAETQGDLEANFCLAHSGNRGERIKLSAKYQPGGPRANPSLCGFVKRESQSVDEIQSRIESANRAIQKALALRDEAIATASNELELLLQKLGASEPKPAAQHTQAQPDLAIPEPAAGEQALPEPPPEDNQTLGIDKSRALQQVLKSITRQKKTQGENTYPFDFSTEERSDYTEPHPKHDGFVAAAERLVSIIEKGHPISVTLSIDSDGAIETEREKEFIFEILRELLTNVVKHAQASECFIAVFRAEDDWVLQVEDDGVGLDKNLVSISTPLNKIGLFQIRTKLALKGGQLELTPTSPKGLIARARLPVSLVRGNAERAE